MNDRELLELAAKAAGLEPKQAWGITLVKGDGHSDPFCPFWNPLTDDGDALRLAVKLGLEIGGITENQVYVRVHGDGDAVLEKVQPCRYAATRRAIVRAAAEIGKAMT